MAIIGGTGIRKRVEPIYRRSVEGNNERWLSEWLKMAERRGHFAGASFSRDIPDGIPSPGYATFRRTVWDVSIVELFWVDKSCKATVLVLGTHEPKISRSFLPDIDIRDQCKRMFGVPHEYLAIAWHRIKEERRERIGSCFNAKALAEWKGEMRQLQRPVG